MHKNSCKSKLFNQSTVVSSFILFVCQLFQKVLYLSINYLFFKNLAKLVFFGSRKKICWETSANYNEKLTVLKGINRFNQKGGKDKLY